MRLLISGSHGFIGKACCNYFKSQGYEVVTLARKKEESNSIFWDPLNGEINKEDFEDFDAMIHLAGKSLFQGRWTKKKKEEIFLSRCRDTWLLSEVLKRLHRPPKTLISVSAIGYYGDRKGELLIEEDAPGQGFLADLCKKWESSTKAIENRGVRVVHPRLGIVLDRQGGMLKKLLLFYERGWGMILGNGQQYISWIALKDLLQIFHHLLLHEEIEGAVNVVAPFVATQQEFVEKFSEYFGKKVKLKIPAFILQILLGEMSNELLLASQNVSAEKLLKSGYSFSFPTLETYLLSQSL